MSSGNPGSMVSAQRFHGKRQLRGNTGLPGWLERHNITSSDMLANLNMSAKEEKNLFLWSFGSEKGQLELFEGRTDAYLLFCEPMKGVVPPFTEHLGSIAR